AELKTFEGKIAENGKLNKSIAALIKTFPKDAHPMSIASAAMVALSAQYPHLTNQDMTTEEKTEIFPIILGQFKAITAAAYRHGQGQDFVESNPSLSYVADFLYMMNGAAAKEEVVKSLDVLLILHADHEQNCSTS